MAVAFQDARNEVFVDAALDRPGQPPRQQLPFGEHPVCGQEETDVRQVELEPFLLHIAGKPRQRGGDALGERRQPRVPEPLDAREVFSGRPPILDLRVFELPVLLRQNPGNRPETGLDFRNVRLVGVFPDVGGVIGNQRLLQRLHLPVVPPFQKGGCHGRHPAHHRVLPEKRVEPLVHGVRHRFAPLEAPF